MKHPQRLGYEVHLDYDREYRGYVATVPSLPGCVSQGKTEQNALDNVADAIRGFLQVMEELQAKNEH